MSRFYVPKEAVEGAKITITGNEAHHVRDVMRLKVSDNVVCFDGTGNEYAGVIKKIDPQAVTVEIIKTSQPHADDPLHITLIQAIPKKEKMDYIAQKATELGVGRIIPVMTERTVVDWDDKKKARSLDRWQKIGRAASKQSGRTKLPDIMPVTSFAEALKVVKGCDLALMAALNDKAIPLKKVLKDAKPGNIVIAIGPEGDFTEQEVDQAVKAGFKMVDLGRRVLRSDTAGLAVIAILYYELSG